MLFLNLVVLKINAWKKIACVFIMTTKRKHNKVTLKTKYEALREFDKNRPNKELAIQFNVSRSTLSTWNQPISTTACWIDYFWIFLATCRGNYRRGWWKWRWKIWWTNCTSLKKWTRRDTQNFEQIKSVHRDLGFDPLIITIIIIKANSHNQSVNR